MQPKAPFRAKAEALSQSTGTIQPMPNYVPRAGVPSSVRGAQSEYQSLNKPAAVSVAPVNAVTPFRVK